MNAILSFTTFCLRKSGAGFRHRFQHSCDSRITHGETTLLVDRMKKALGAGALPGIPSTVGKSSVGSKIHMLWPNWDGLPLGLFSSL